MKRLKRYTVAVTLVVAAALCLVVWPGVASASTTINVTLKERGTYACRGPCATATNFTISGTLHADTKVLGTMSESGAGTVLDFNPVTNCLEQVVNYAFTTQNRKNTIDLASTSSFFCFTSDPNVSVETDSYTITGGTGLFSAATGSATSTGVVLAHPQTGTATFNLSLTY